MAKKKSNKAVRSNSIIVRSMSWVDDPKKVDKFFWGMIAFGVVLTLIDLFYTKKVYFQSEHIFGSYSFFGLITCIALLGFAKLLRVVLKRPEAYYAPQSVEAESHPEFDLDRKQTDA